MDSTTAAGGPQDDVVGPSDDAAAGVPRSGSRSSDSASCNPVGGVGTGPHPFGRWTWARLRAGGSGGLGGVDRGHLRPGRHVWPAEQRRHARCGGPAGKRSRTSRLGCLATPSDTPATASATPEASQPTGPLSKPRKIYWEDLKAGMCLKAAPESALDMPVVDCRAAHEDEVITRTVMAGPSKWPGDEVIDTSADTKCRTAFATYVGIGVRRLTAGAGLLDRRPGRMARRRQDPRLPGVRPSDPTLTRALKGTAQ